MRDFVCFFSSCGFSFKIIMLQFQETLIYASSIHMNVWIAEWNFKLLIELCVYEKKRDE